jgi:hypothetical protein
MNSTQNARLTAARVASGSTCQLLRRARTKAPSAAAPSTGRESSLSPQGCATKRTNSSAVDQAPRDTSASWPAAYSACAFWYATVSARPPRVATSGASHRSDTTAKLAVASNRPRQPRRSAREISSTGTTTRPSCGRQPIAAEATPPRASARARPGSAFVGIASQMSNARNISAGASDIGSARCTSDAGARNTSSEARTPKTRDR